MVNEIYKMLIEHSEWYNSYTSEYSPEAMEAIEDYLDKQDIKWSVLYDHYPDMTGCVVSFCWIDKDGELQHISFDMYQ